MPTHNSDQMLLECCLGKHFSHFMEKEEEKKHSMYLESKLLAPLLLN